jgi:hypothetical protein
MIQSYMNRARYGVNLMSPLGILGIGLYSYFQTKSGQNGPPSTLPSDDLLEKRGRCYEQLSAYGKCLEVTGYCYLACERELEDYKRCLQNHPTKE